MVTSGEGGSSISITTRNAALSYEELRTIYPRVSYSRALQPGEAAASSAVANITPKMIISA
jgi:hypothetical protein